MVRGFFFAGRPDVGWITLGWPFPATTFAGGVISRREWAIHHGDVHAVHAPTSSIHRDPALTLRLG